MKLQSHKTRRNSVQNIIVRGPRHIVAGSNDNGQEAVLSGNFMPTFAVCDEYDYVRLGEDCTLRNSIFVLFSLMWNWLY